MFRFWDGLSEGERSALAAQCATVDLAFMSTLWNAHASSRRPPCQLAPHPVIGLADPCRVAAGSVGREMLSAGEVAFLTVAGGQATRLGTAIPKGMFPIGPATGKTLFAWQAEQVLGASRRYGRELPWVILVSDATAAVTESCFEAAGWFGLEGRVRFVRQRMLPTLDETGSLVLEGPGSLAMAPNGHGGTIEALGRGGAFEWLRRWGVRFVSYFQIDNPLVNAADAAFLGHLRVAGAEMSAKVVEKRDPFERAGVVALIDGRPGVLEYSELPDDKAREREADGRYRYRHASIAAHGFALSFLERMAERPLPYHAARKKVGCVGADGRPHEVWGVKFETFIFDAIPEAQGFFAWLAAREEEFAPLKNAVGEDSPETVRDAIVERGRRWYAASGRAAPDAPEALEVSPLAACDLESFREMLVRNEARR